MERKNSKPACNQEKMYNIYFHKEAYKQIATYPSVIHCGINCIKKKVTCLERIQAKDLQ